MAIKVSGTTVIDNSINLLNTTSITFADATAQTTASSGGGGVGEVIHSAGDLLFTLDNPNPYGTSASDFFGESVSISGRYAVVGADYEDEAGGSSSGKVYVYDAITGEMLHTLNNPNAYSTVASDYFGFRVAVDGKYAVVGAYGEDDAGGTGSGKVYVFDVTTGQLVHTLDNPTAYGTSGNDNFGRAVAISGNYAIFGVYNEDDAGGNSSGKAYIFNVTTGKLVHTLDNPNPYGTSASDQFGISAAISGNYAAVGANAEDDATTTSSGRVYVYNVGSGELLYTLTNPNAYGTANDDFGIDVSLSGNYLIAGVQYEDDAGGLSSGKVYIFDVTTGNLLHTLDNPNAYSTSASDFFGGVISISGKYMIASAVGEDDSNGTTSGKAYIFDVTTGELVLTLDNPNPYGTATSDYFSNSVSISGNYAIVSAYLEDDTSGTSSGKAYIYAINDSYRMNGIKEIEFDNGFKLESSSKLFETAHVGGELIRTIENPNPVVSASDWFGVSGAISGNYAIVGASREDDANTDSGKAYIFNVTTGELLHTLDNPNGYDTGASDYFGEAVAISGKYAAVAALYEDDAGGGQSGKVYIYDVKSGTKITTIDNPNAYDTSANDNFGTFLSMEGDRLAVGVPVEDDAGGSASGKVYLFDIPSGTLLHTFDNPNAYSTSAGDRFGPVSIGGNYMIVGAYLEDGIGSGSGVAYVYDLSTYTLLYTLDDPNADTQAAGDIFGVSVAISNNRAIVGAAFEQQDGNTESGKAYIFDLATGSLLHTLDNPNAYDTSQSDQFGERVAIDGNYAVVAARFEDDAGGTTSGKVYIFDVSTGALLHTLDNPNPYGTSASDYFGQAISISGNNIIATAWWEDTAGIADSGIAYIFSATKQTYLDKLVNLIP